MPVPTYDCLTIGDALVDTIIHIDPSVAQKKTVQKQQFLCFPYAEKIPIHQLTESVGGNAANVAAGLAQMHNSSALYTELGFDKHADSIIEELKKLDVNTKEIRQQKKRQTRFSVVLNYKGERTILSYNTSTAYKKRKLPTARLYYLSSLGEGFSTLAQQVKKRCTQSPASLFALNPGSYQMKHNLSTIRQFLPFIDLLFVNKEEAQKIIGKVIHSEKTLLRSLSNMGTKQVIMTNGVAGSYCSNGVQAWHMPIYPVKKVIAKTGAGDAYASGFIAAILEGLSVPQAMQYGAANASGVVQEIGAQHGLLNKKEAKRFIKEYQQITPLPL